MAFDNDDEHSKSRWRSRAAVQIRAQQLRQEQTPAEAILWSRLRNRQPDGFKFRRQHIIGRFVVDFCCAEQRLIVEIDGSKQQDTALFATPTIKLTKTSMVSSTIFARC
jgi:very-short-patch-repair endonuclease